MNNLHMKKRFTDFDILMHEKKLLFKRKLERLKFTNGKQSVIKKLTKLMMETIVLMLA